MHKLNWILTKFYRLAAVGGVSCYIEHTKGQLLVKLEP